MAKKKAGPPRSRGTSEGRSGARRPPKAEKRAASPQRARKKAADLTGLAEKPEVVVVGIGASAGGLKALREFFRNVKDDSGLAYVVVVHLSPEHESHLADLLQPHSKMRVLQVSETVALKPNCVYVIPPNSNLSAIDTHLRLSALEERRTERAPIDHFFRTLAETHDGHAIGVILSGTGSDGTLGIKEIKLKGGLTVVQDPNEAEYDGMPQSAIATGFVDMVLPVSNIPVAVLRFARTEPKLKIAQDGETLEVPDRVLLQKVLAQVRARTGRDFTRYKRSTIMRRIQRRMQLRYVEDLGRYVELLRETPDEIRALSDDLLITVTSFFRDPEVFHELRQKIIPHLYEGKSPDDEVRIWCVGCATGEEVYSLAILALETAAKKEGLAPKLHIFASDLHEHSLELAREGFYAGDIAPDISKDRLRRFFTEETGGYRVRKEVREAIVFAPHNLLGDPPFSRLDMIVCRNLMIYLQRDVQTDVLRIFHYALKPGGYLVLGTSESVDDAELFRAVDKPHAIFRRGHGQLPEPRLPVFPISRRHQHGPTEEAEPLPVPQRYEAMHATLVSAFSPPSALVGPDGQIVHLSENAGRFLAHPGGRLTTNAAKLVRKELSVELVTALHIAHREHRAVHSKPIRVGFNGDSKPVVLHVFPALDPQIEGYSLVIFGELDASAVSAGPLTSPEHADKRIAELTHELNLTRQRLQGIVEEFETSQEEMRATNEELQSANEELRSTMEELETSKEELQSMNEELQTVNQENRHKVEELALLSSDLQNLLSATGIATLFLDRDFKILRFTPKVGELFNMRLTDRGRPVSDLTHRLGYPELQSDADQVLRNLTRVEREVKDEGGRWYLTQLLPYRSSDDRIAGIVITFVDITRRKTGEDQIRDMSKSLERRVTERTRQVRELTTSLVRAEQGERRRLSETLHDELQQLLYGVQLKLRMAKDEINASRPGEATQQLIQTEALLARSTRVTRQLSVDLNPPILKNEGLNAILDWLQKQMKELHDLEVSLETDGEIRIDDGDVRVLLFQVFRELLFNVAKHSGTRKATVSLKELDGHIEFSVADEGQGFDAARQAASEHGKPSIGLKSVRERVGLLGGQLQVDSSPGGGTHVQIRLPRAAKIGG